MYFAVSDLVSDASNASREREAVVSRSVYLSVALSWWLCGERLPMGERLAALDYCVLGGFGGLFL